VHGDEQASDLARRYLAYMPQSFREEPALAEPREPASGAAIADLIPAEASHGYDMRKVLDALVDAGSFLEVKKLYARELLTGFARLGGRTVGVLANQPMQKGGVLFVDSADKASRFIWLCDAFNLPLLFVADVPGFMIGTAVE